MWHIIGWFTHNWWAIPEPNSDCSKEQIAEVTQGAIYASVTFKPSNMDVVGVSGFTSREIDDIVKTNEKERFGSNERFFTYDTVWACALALNESIKKLHQLGEFFLYLSCACYFHKKMH